MFSSGIFKKLMLINICIGSIPVFLLTVFILIQSYKSTSSQLYRARKQQLEHFTENIHTRFTACYDMLNHICADTTIHTALTRSEDMNSSWINGTVISKEINKYIGFNKNFGIENCIVYSQISDCPVYHQNVTMYDYIVYESWYTTYKTSAENYFFYKKPNMESLTMSFIKPVVATDFSNSYYGKCLGFIKLDINLDDFFNSFLPIEPDNIHTVFVLSEKNRLLYNAHPLLYESDTDSLLQKIRDGGDFSYTLPNFRKNLFISQSTLPRYGLKIAVCFNDNTVRTKLAAILKITVCMSFISIVLMFVFAYYLSGKIALRVNTLLAKMKRVEHGDLKIKMPYAESAENRDEIGIIEKQFDKMIIRLHHAIKKNYIAEIENREACLRLLQFQINPHFLYNTLESVSAIAVQKKAYSICEITQKLSEMFRYAVSRQPGESATLAEELCHIENYMFIQKIRFPDMFGIQYNIPEKLKNCLLPCFIIQPLAENAVNHGLKECTSGGSIKIYALEKNDILYIGIADNGMGIAPKRLKEIRDNLNSDIKMHKIETYNYSIGLKNVHARIQTRYGKAYGLEITSTVQKGTEVILKIPVIYSNGGSDVQHTYSR